MCSLVSFGALKKSSSSTSAWESLRQEPLKGEWKSQAFPPKRLLAVLSLAARQPRELGEKRSETRAGSLPSASAFTSGQCPGPWAGAAPFPFAPGKTMARAEEMFGGEKNMFSELSLPTFFKKFKVRVPFTSNRASGG